MTTARAHTDNFLPCLTPFVERLAIEEEKKAGMIPPEVLKQMPGELHRRYRGQHASAREDAASSAAAWHPHVRHRLSSPSEVWCRDEAPLANAVFPVV